MTDRELLEWAAKAVEYNGGRWHENPDASLPWNPITDDGDRYRLARTLKMRICFDTRQVECPLFDSYGFFIRSIVQRWGDEEGMPKTDAEAIVRAAAEIGRSMK